MHILIAPDSFKGSLSATEVANTIASVIQKKIPGAQITAIPFSDGGEGALDFLQQNFKGELHWVATQNAAQTPIKAPYYRMKSKAWIELSQAAGLAQLNKKAQNPCDTSTYGVGLLLEHALNHGANEIYLGIGGSATHDLGIGIFCALGGKAMDINRQAFLPTGGTLDKITSLDDSNLHPRLAEATLQIVCDVSNPLIGKNGAAQVFARQKGADDQTIKKLENNSIHLGRLFESHCKKPILNVPKTGAAGGTAAGMKALLKAKLSSGFDTFYAWAQMDKLMGQVDLLITGEGCLDRQSANGKVPISLAQKAKEKGIPCMAVCGQILLNATDLQRNGIVYAQALTEKSQSLKDAQQNATKWLVLATESLLQNYIKQ